jgi:hypothetical protein
MIGGVETRFMRAERKSIVLIKSPQESAWGLLAQSPQESADVASGETNKRAIIARLNQTIGHAEHDKGQELSWQNTEVKENHSRTISEQSKSM